MATRPQQSPLEGWEEAYRGDAGARRAVHDAERRADRGRSTPRRTCRRAERDRRSRASIRSRAASTRDVPRPAVDDAPVRRLRDRRGDQRALPLPARPRPDRAVDGVRHAVADGPRLRSPRSRWARSAARASPSTRSTTWRRCSPASTLGEVTRVDDDQRAGGDHARLLRRRRRGPGRPADAPRRARSRPTSSRSTSPRRSGASRSTRRCGCSAT